METRKPMEILPEARNSKNETRNLEDDGRAGESRQCAKEEILDESGGTRG
jgi:hypothetical protein